MKPGVYSDISNDDYHSGPGISKSGLDLIARSPMHYWHAVNSANDNQPTAAQAIGTAAHCLILEPEQFAKRYCLALRPSDVPHAIDNRDQLVAMVQALNAERLPKLATGGSKAEQIERILAAQHEHGHETWVPDQLGSMTASDLKEIIQQMNSSRTGLLPISGTRHELAELLRANGVDVTLWSDVQAEWLENNQGRIILNQDQWDQIHGMRDSVMDHLSASALLRAPGDAEMSVYWNDPETGVLCRCRPDYWRHDNVVVDLKTTEDASPEGFARSIANWRYDVQAAFYTDGIKSATGRDVRAFVFIAVEKKPPYAVGVYVLDSASLELGRAQYRADLYVYAECVEDESWPGYSNRIETIELPAWHANKNRRLLEEGAA